MRVCFFALPLFFAVAGQLVAADPPKAAPVPSLESRVAALEAELVPLKAFALRMGYRPVETKAIPATSKQSLQVAPAPVAVETYKRGPFGFFAIKVRPDRIMYAPAGGCPNCAK